LTYEGKSKGFFVPVLNQTPHSEGFRAECLTPILYGGEWLASRLSRSNPGKIILMGLRANVNCLDERYVPCSCRESNPSSSAVQPEALHRLPWV